MKRRLLQIFLFGLDFLQDAVLFFLVFGMLVFSYNKTIQGIVFERFVFFEFSLVALIFLWILTSFIRGKIRISRMPIDGLFIFLCVVFAVSTLFSGSTYRGLWGTFNDPFLGTMGFLSLCVFAFFIASTYSKRVFRTMASALIIAGWTVFGGLAHWRYFPSAQGTDAEFIAFWILLFGICLSIVFLSDMKKNTHRYFLKKGVLFGGQLFLLISLGVFLFSLTRVLSGFFLESVCLGLGVMMLFVFSGKVKLSKAGLFLTGLLTVFFVLFGSFGDIFSGTSLQERFPTVSILRQVAWKSILESPVLGYGPGLYGKAYALHKLPETNQTTHFLERFFSGPGGVWEWISTTGLLGTVLFFLIIAGCAGVVWYALKHDARSDNRDLLCFFSAWVALIPVLTWHMYNGILLFLFFLCAGALFGSLRERSIWMDARSKEISLRIDPQYTLVVFFGVVFIFGSMGFLLYRIGEKALAGKTAHVAQQTENSNEVISFLERAVELDPKEPEYFRRLGEAHVAVAMQESLKKDADASFLEEQFNAAFEKSSQAFQLAPGEVGVAESLARVYESANTAIPQTMELALKQYALAKTMEPSNPIFSFKEGMLLLQQVRGDAKMDPEVKKKKLNESIDRFKEAISKASNFPLAYYELALVYREKGDQSKAEESVKKAIEMDPNNKDSILFLASLYIENSEKLDEAKPLLDRVEAIDSNDVTTYLYLGRYYAKKKLNAEAEDAYMQAMDRLPEGQDEIKKYIEKLIQELTVPQEAPQEALQSSESTPESAQTAGGIDSESSPESVPKPEVTPAPEPVQTTLKEEEKIDPESKPTEVKN